MKKIFTLVILLQAFIFVSAVKTETETVNVPGVLNPLCFSISPDGLKMVIVDWPKKGMPIMKQAVRPYLESNWGAADEIPSINKLIGEKVRVDAPCISFDGKYLYFSANFSDTKGGMDIYYCTLEYSGWSAPVNCGSVVNSEASENCPSISGNNRNLVFTRHIKMKRFDDYHTGEIWTSNIDSASEKWLKPEKVNTEINSGGICYPKIYDDNKTLLYSRIIDDKEKWEICWVKRLGDLHWYLPVEIDTLNSKYNELSPVYCQSDKYIYFILNESTDQRPDCKLFRFKLPDQFKPEKTIVIKGKVIDPVNNTHLQAKLLVTDPILSRIKFFTTSDEKTGEWKMLLNASETLMFHVWKEKYSHQYKLFTLSETAENFNNDFSIFPQTELTLNIYDKEELWPLDGEIKVKGKDGNDVEIIAKKVLPGRKSFILPIGIDYEVTVTMENYYPNNLGLALSNIVLFNKFVRDIELEPVKRDIEIYVTDEETRNPLSAHVELYDFKRGKKFIPDIVKGQIGLFSTTLREGDKFDVEVIGPKGFAFNHAEIDLATDKSLQRLNIELKPLKRKVAIRLNNINFEFNSADLMESSHEELDRVLQLIKDNPDIKVEIMAHTDDKGSDKYNNVLADKRAKSVVDYLIMNGAENNRLIARGYGESMPLVPNDSEENCALNRRVEMKILDLEETINTLEGN